MAEKETLARISLLLKHSNFPGIPEEAYPTWQLVFSGITDELLLKATLGVLAKKENDFPVVPGAIVQEARRITEQEFDYDLAEMAWYKAKIAAFCDDPRALAALDHPTLTALQSIGVQKVLMMEIDESQFMRDRFIRTYERLLERIVDTAVQPPWKELLPGGELEPLMQQMSLSSKTRSS